mgnify:CR=1 FL=1
MSSPYPILQVMNNFNAELIRGTIPKIVEPLHGSVVNYAIYSVSGESFFQRKIDDIKSLLDGMANHAFRDEIDKPLMGYHISDLLPLISDPQRKHKGAISVQEKKLIYSENNSPVHDLRDTYLWAYSPNSLYVERGFLHLVQDFLDEGYELLQSPQTLMVDSPLRDFNNLRKINLEDILTK